MGADARCAANMPRHRTARSKQRRIGQRAERGRATSRLAAPRGPRVRQEERLGVGVGARRSLRGKYAAPQKRGCVGEGLVAEDGVFDFGEDVLEGV